MSLDGMFDVAIHSDHDETFGDYSWGKMKRFHPDILRTEQGTTSLTTKIIV